jgi:putative FmdB family regulatory protein
VKIPNLKGKVGIALLRKVRPLWAVPLSKGRQSATPLGRLQKGIIMPHYDFECLSCHHKFEMFQNMSDKVLSKCPKCGKKVKRLIGSGTGLIFKGSGFYATDYKKPSKGNVQSSCSLPENKCANCPKHKAHK